MGFTDDAMNLRVLSKSEGNVQSAVDQLIIAASRKASVPIVAPLQPTYTHVVTPQPQYQPHQQRSTISRFPESTLSKLHARGFTNDEENDNALLITDGNVDKSILLLQEWRANRAGSAGGAPTRRASKNGIKKEAPKTMDIFGAVAESNDFGEFTGYQNAPQSQPILTVPSPAQINNDPMDIFSNFSVAPAIQQQQEVSMQQAKTSQIDAIKAMMNSSQGQNPYGAPMQQSSFQQAQIPFAQGNSFQQPAFQQSNPFGGAQQQQAQTSNPFAQPHQNQNPMFGAQQQPQNTLYNTPLPVQNPPFNPPAQNGLFTSSQSQSNVILNFMQQQSQPFQQSSQSNPFQSAPQSVFQQPAQSVFQQPAQPFQSQSQPSQFQAQSQPSPFMSQAQPSYMPQGQGQQFSQPQAQSFQPQPQNPFQQPKQYGLAPQPQSVPHI
jgi:hypothetical protein